MAFAIVSKHIIIISVDSGGNNEARQDGTRSNVGQNDIAAKCGEKCAECPSGQSLSKCKQAGAARERIRSAAHK